VTDTKFKIDSLLKQKNKNIFLISYKDFKTSKISNFIDLGLKLRPCFDVFNVNILIF